MCVYTTIVYFVVFYLNVVLKMCILFVLSVFVCEYPSVNTELPFWMSLKETIKLIIEKEMCHDKTSFYQFNYKYLYYNGVSICTVFLNTQVEPVAFSSFIRTRDDSCPAVFPLETKNKI